MDTKNIITDALYRLTLKMSYNNITVQNIIDESNVSRATFYKYFYDKHAAMASVYKRYVDSILPNLDTARYAEVTRSIHQYVYDNSEYFDKISKIDGANSFWEFLYSYIYSTLERHYLKHTKAALLTISEKALLEAACASNTQLMKFWLKNMNKISIEEISDLSIETIPRPFRNYLIE